MYWVPKFADFAERIKRFSLPKPTENEKQQLLLEESEKARIYYAPFDWINLSAKVVIVGITPGEHSMVNALMEAAAALRAGETIEEACKRGKRVGSFSNMRFTIADMLDQLGLPDALGLTRSEELFSTRCDLLHPTSCMSFCLGPEEREVEELYRPQP